MHTAPRLKAFHLRLSLGLLLINLLAALLTAFLLWRSHQHYEARNIASAENLAHALDQVLSDGVSKADLSLWAIKDEYERPYGPRPLDRRDLDAFIAQHCARQPMLDSLRVADATGLITHGVGVPLGSKIYVTDRDYFIQLRDHPQAGLVVTKPLIGKISGKWAIIFARRLETPAHSFAGVVYAAVMLDQFNRTLASLDIGQQGVVTLRDLDHRIISRYPGPGDPSSLIGQQAASPELIQLIQAGKTNGVFHARNPIDGVQRDSAFRKIQGLPFHIVVGLSTEEALSGWRHEVLQACLGIGLTLGLSALAAILLCRAWKHQEQTNRALKTALDQVKTLNGMLPICCKCKKIRDDHGYWNRLEVYLSDHSEAEFTHGLCPDCVRELYPDLDFEEPVA